VEWDRGNSLNIPQGFEETLHEVFVRSKGEKSLEEARARFQRESEEYQEELTRIEEQIEEMSRKVRVAFMDTDFERWDELK
jgi:hypothetical protein